MIPRKLSPQQERIAYYVTSGLSNKEIAQQMNLSCGTVRYYVSIILSKLSLNNRMKLAVWYLSKHQNWYLSKHQNRV